MLGVGKGSMVMKMVWTESPLAGAFRDYRSSADSTDSTAQHMKYCRAESPTRETPLETDFQEDPHLHPRSHPFRYRAEFPNEERCEQENSLVPVRVTSRRGATSKGESTAKYIGVNKK